MHTVAENKRITETALHWVHASPPKPHNSFINYKHQNTINVERKLAILINRKFYFAIQLQISYKSNKHNKPSLDTKNKSLGFSSFYLEHSDNYDTLFLDCCKACNHRGTLGRLHKDSDDKVE